MHKKMQDSAECPPAHAGDYLTRGETLELLQVKLQTLYAYVSRGLIRSVPQGSNGRRLYARQDVEKMKSRADARSGHAPVAAAAMRWGEPIIQSTITRISPDGPMYRGVLAVDLARSGITFEEVAGLLWKTGASGALNWQPCQRTTRFAEAYARNGLVDPRRELLRYLADIVLRFGDEHLRNAVDPGAQLAESSRMIATMAQCIAHLKRQPASTSTSAQSQRGCGIAERLLVALGGDPSAQHVAALDAALVLCADHELAQATFVARIAASAGADIGECIAAAVLTQTGLTSARSYQSAEDLLRACRTPAQTQRLFDAEYAAHRNLPGFNHPLYPDGDPRARYLIDMVRGLGGRQSVVAPLHAALAMAAQHGCLPSLEIGLTMLAIVMGLPRRSAYALFIIARCAGWIAHIIEQRESGALIRPRADYSPGAQPEPRPGSQLLPLPPITAGKPAVSVRRITLSRFITGNR
ncbi:citrate/2-methylcitrate synthase [Caballeronia sp. DA-9]|uniref:citrate/2-methylcitrate synthase n=1 Tax=Caballeronia sp. DA-9 TaxID=3436237 RepID=UPI003F6797B3